MVDYYEKQNISHCLSVVSDNIRFINGGSCHQKSTWHKQDNINILCDGRKHCFVDGAALQEEKLTHKKRTALKSIKEEKMKKPYVNMKKMGLLSVIALGICAIAWSVRVIFLLASSPYSSSDFGFDILLAILWIAAFIVSLKRYRSVKNA